MLCTTSLMCWFCERMFVDSYPRNALSAFNTCPHLPLKRIIKDRALVRKTCLSDRWFCRPFSENYIESGCLRLYGGNTGKEQESLEAQVLARTTDGFVGKPGENIGFHNQPFWLQSFSTLFAIGTIIAMLHVVSNASSGRMYLSSFSAGLASSSCCVFQLLINGLSALGFVNIGCAGFNKTLGPFRVFFRSITAAWLLILWIMGLRNAWPLRQLAITSFIAAFLSFLPELITVLGSSSQVNSGEKSELTFSVEGMSCEACQRFVKSIVDATPGVLGSHVDRNIGIARIRVAKGGPFQVQEILTRLKTKNYRATYVASIDLPAVSPDSEQSIEGQSIMK